MIAPPVSLKVRPRSLRVPISLCAYTLLGVLGLCWAYYKIFMEFSVLDDEGTIMLSVWGFFEDTAAHKNMYGPFFFLYQYGLHALLNAPVSHDVTRLTSIAIWITTATGCALFTHRSSQSLILGALVQVKLILHLRTIVNEPGHPQELALLLVTGVLLLCATLVTSERGRALGSLGIGAIVGALLLTKVNLGVYLGAATVLTLLPFLPRGRARTAIGWVVATLAVILPAAVMWRHLGEPWGRYYCLVVTLALAAALPVSFRMGLSGNLGWREARIAASGVLLTLSACFVLVLLLGGSPWAVAEACLIWPVTFSSIFIVAAPITLSMLYTGMASLVLALLYAWKGAGASEGGRVAAAYAALKLAYASIVLCWGFFPTNDYLSDGALIACATPWLWLVLVAPGRNREWAFRQALPRMCLCFVAVLMALQAYPIHGSQSRWATFLLLPAAAICLADAWETLARVVRDLLEERGQVRVTQRLSKLRPVVTVILFVSLGTWFYDKVDIASLRTRYEKLTPLNLPGAERIHLGRGRVGIYQGLTSALRTHCDGFIGMPSSPSYYFWTGIAPPGVVMGAWMIYSDNQTQETIVEKMQSYERPCAVWDQLGVQSWTSGRNFPGPLRTHIMMSYKPSITKGRYRLLIPLPKVL